MRTVDFPVTFKLLGVRSLVSGMIHERPTRGREREARTREWV